MSKQWIYLSPHLDDAVYSCGGLISQQVQRGEKAAVWTVFAGDPAQHQMTPYAQSLHERWGTGLNAAVLRRVEDQTACEIVGAEPRHFQWLDCIYRSVAGLPLVSSDDDLFNSATPVQQDLAAEIVAMLQEQVPAEASVVVPLGAGNHIDHRVARMAAETAELDLLYYADVPYVLGHQDEVERLTAEMQPAVTEQITASAMDKWLEAAAAYKSQMSTFWDSKEALRQQFKDYLGLKNTCCLWIK